LNRSVKKPLSREPGTKAEETEAVLERRRRQSLKVEKRQVDTEKILEYEWAEWTIRRGKRWKM